MNTTKKYQIKLQHVVATLAMSGEALETRYTQGTQRLLATSRGCLNPEQRPHVPIERFPWLLRGWPIAPLLYWFTVTGTLD